MFNKVFNTCIGRNNVFYCKTVSEFVFALQGKRYWEISGSRVLRKHGRSLTQLGLPADVSRVDAAFVWGHLQRMYLVTGRTYWRLVESGQSVLLHGYPRDVTGVWAGVKIPIDAAFTHTDGQCNYAFIPLKVMLLHRQLESK